MEIWKIKEIYLSYCGLNSEYVNSVNSFVKHNPQLIGLGLCGFKMNDNEFESILETVRINLFSMKTFKINNCSNKISYKSIVNFLKKNTTIRKLGLFGVTITESDEFYFQNSIFHLRSFNFTIKMLFIRIWKLLI